MAETGPRRRWLAAAGVGALAAAAGYGAYLWRGAPDGDAPNAAAVQALLEIPLIDLQGGTKAIATWRGQVLVINFWATWCAPCREEIPEFVRIQARLGSRGLQLVGIAIDQPQQVEAFAREFRINYPLLIGSLELMALMRESGNRAGVLPFTLVLDRQGRVTKAHRGVFKEAKLEAVLQPLL